MSEDALPLPPDSGVTRPLRPLLAAAQHKAGQSTSRDRHQSGGRRQAKALLRAEQILALYVDEKLTYAEIAARAGVSPQRVHQIIDAALAEAVGRTRELAEFAFDRELLLIEAIIREAAEIIRRKCDVCGGDEERRAHCKGCKRTGYAYPAQRRLLAMDRIGPAQSRRIKLTGLDKDPQPTSHPADAYYEMLQKLSDEAFEAERARFEAALAARPTHA